MNVSDSLLRVIDVPDLNVQSNIQLITQKFASMGVVSIKTGQAISIFGLSGTAAVRIEQSFSSVFSSMIQVSFRGQFTYTVSVSVPLSTSSKFIIELMEMDRLMATMASEPNLSVRQSITTILKLDGYGDGHTNGNSMCKQAFTLHYLRYTILFSLGLVEMVFEIRLEHANTTTFRLEEKLVCHKNPGNLYTDVE